MRFRGWHVEGFGLLHNFRVVDLPRGVTVVFGPNEAGKTSLLAFIRGVLFGYPDRRRRDRQYPPLRGGRHGGRVTLEDQGREWTVERYASPAHLVITRPDGSVGSEGDLRGLLGSADAELHSNVFAFSLSELQEFGTLQADSVKDRIFSAGVVGAGRSARVALGALAEERAAIGRKRGDCRINELRTRLAAIDDALVAAKSRAAGHPQLRQQVEALDAEQRRLGGQLSDARRELAELDGLLGAWPDWDDARQGERDLAALPATPVLPDDYPTRLDADLSAREREREKLRERCDAVTELERRVDALVPDDSLASVAAEVRRLAARGAGVRSARARVRQLEGESAQDLQRAEEEAARLGPGWKASSARALDSSIPAAQDITTWGERLKALDASMQEAERREGESRKAVKAVELEIERRTAALAARPPLADQADLERRAAAVRLLRIRLAEIVALRAYIRGAEKIATDAQAAAQAAESDALRLDGDVGSRREAIRSADEAPAVDDLRLRERALRDLRVAHGEMGERRAALRSMEASVTDADQRAQEARVAVDTRERELAERVARLAAGPPVIDDETLRVRTRASRDLRARLGELNLLRDELRAAQGRAADVRARPHGGPTSRSARRTLIAGAAILVVVGAALLLVGEPVASAVALVAAAGAALLGFGLPASAVAVAPDPLVERSEQDVRRVAARIAEVDSAALLAAKHLGCVTLPDLLALETITDALERDVRARQDADRETIVIDAIRSDIRRFRADADRLAETATKARAALSTPREQLRAHEESTLAVAATVGLSVVPTPRQVEDSEAELRRQVERRLEQDRAVKSLEDAERDLVEARVTHEVAQAAATAAATELERVAGRERGRRAELLATAATVGLEKEPDASQVEELAGRVDADLRTRSDRDAEAGAIAELRRRAVEAEVATTEAREGVASAGSARNDAELAWGEWKRARGCPDALRPETAQQFFGVLERVRDRAQRADTANAAARAATAEIDAFTAAALRVRENVANASKLPDLVAEELSDVLREWVDQDTLVRAERVRLEEELTKARAVVVSSERTAARAEERVVATLGQAGAADESECRRRIATSRRRVELSATVRAAEQRLRTRLGEGARADLVRTRLAAGDCPTWEARRQELKGALVEQQRSHEAAVRQDQTAVKELEALEHQTDVVALANEREGVIAEIESALREWRQLAVAHALIQSTLRRYEVERQPAVMTRAAASFAHVTGSRYTRLVVRESSIDVIAEDGSRLDVGALSRGTAEQLYLCLRLALAAEFGRASVSLPLVMDDVLVNFDPERARLTAQLICDASADNQVLLFTCHPEVVDLLVGLDPDVRVVEIERAAAAPPIAVAAETSAVPGSIDATPVPSTLPEGASETVLDALRSAGRPLSRAEILAATSIPESRWTAVIQQLRIAGLVVARGRKRGTTWSLPGWREDYGAQPSDLAPSE